MLFVPIVAERDGHEFIADAVAAGAAAYLTAGPVPPPGTGVSSVAGVTGLLVADTAAALTALGAAARARLADRVIGVTGSVGKTSVKDLLAAALSTTFVTTAAANSFNNELGVPLTLCNGPDASEAAVIEMGARGQGHIAQLCRVARPTVGVVTRVAPAHLELFGSLQDVARAKGELIEALPPGPAGVAVLNAEDPLVLAMASRGPASVLTYAARPPGGSAGGVEVWAEGIRVDSQARARFELHSPWGSSPVALSVAGVHMVGNALAALAAAMVAGVGLADAVGGIEAAALSPWRMEVSTAASGATILNDAYNASPVAVLAAFEALLALGPPGRGRRLAVLGLMAELGEGSGAAHVGLAAEAARRGIELFAVGTAKYGVDPTRRWSDVESAALALERMELSANDVVLVKASRVAGLERLAQRLAVGGRPSTPARNTSPSSP